MGPTKLSNIECITISENNVKDQSIFVGRFHGNSVLSVTIKYYIKGYVSSNILLV
jgi:hypothetical protein